MPEVSTVEIIMTKGEHRNALTCIRENGSQTHENLGPDLPHHDIAHFVVESHFKLSKGFYGNIRSGMSIQQLSDKEVIKTLGPESWLAEIMTRALQSLTSGATTIKQYAELIQWEARNMSGVKVPEISQEDVRSMHDQLNDHCSKWAELGIGEKLVLKFE